MIIISWNCWGIGNPRAVHALGELVRSHQSHLLFLCETLVHADKIEEFKSKLKLETGFCVNRIGKGWLFFGNTHRSVPSSVSQIILLTLLLMI